LRSVVPVIEAHYRSEAFYRALNIASDCVLLVVAQSANGALGQMLYESAGPPDESSMLVALGSASVAFISPAQRYLVQAPKRDRENWDRNSVRVALDLCHGESGVVRINQPCSVPIAQPGADAQCQVVSFKDARSWLLERKLLQADRCTSEPLG